MDELQRHAAPLVELWRKLNRQQQFAMAAVIVGSVVGISFLLIRPEERWKAVADGRHFTASEVAAIQSSWRQAGLRSYRKEADTLLVSERDLARYTAALPESFSKSTDSSTEWDKQLSRANFLTSHEQLEQLKDNALRNEICRVLKAIPAIADVDLIWARGKGRSAFAAKSKVTATISVVPRDGHDLTSSLAQSLRTAVARMIPDLDAGDVVVLDQSTGLAVTDADDDLLTVTQQRRQNSRLEKSLEAAVRVAVSHVPGATASITKRATTGDPDRRTAWEIGVQVPSVFFDARLAEQLIESNPGWSYGQTADDSWSQLEEDECRFLERRVLASVVPITSDVEVVVCRSDNIAIGPEASASSSFTAWPHLVCLLMASLIVFQFGRRRPSEHASTEVDLSDVSASTVPAGVEEIGVADSFDYGDQPALTTTMQVASTLHRAESLRPIERLLLCEPRQLGRTLRDERPQTIAVLLVQFPASLATECLAQLPASSQTEVIRRLKSLTEISDDMLDEIASSVLDRMEMLPSSRPHNRVAHLLVPVESSRACV